MTPATRSGFSHFARLILTAAGPCLLIALAPYSPRHAGGGLVATLSFLGLGLLLAGGWAALLLHGRRADEGWARRHPLVWWGALAVASGVITVSLVGENVHAKWGAIDDHYYVGAMGPEGRITLGQSLHMLASSPEVGRPGPESQRYRPTFWITRHVEMLLWSAVPERFWAFRVFMFGLTFMLAWWALWVWLGGVEAGAVVAWLFTFTFWCDVWCRLGCSEGHNALGTAMFAAAAAALTLEARRSRGTLRPMRRLRTAAAWGVMFLGIALAIGAKENLLVLTPLMGLFILWHGWRRLRIEAWVGVALVVALSALIAGVVFVATRNAKVDFYANPASLGFRLRAAMGWIGSRQGLGWAALAGLGLLAAVPAWFAPRWLQTATARASFARFTRPRAWLIAALVMTLFSQVFFYVGEFPTNTRYDFPGLVAVLLVAVVLADLVLGLLDRAAGRGWGTLARVAAVTALLLVTLDRGYATIRRESHLNVETTRSFTESMDGVAREARQKPERPLVFVAYQPEEQETVSSVAIFLRARAVTNPIYLVNRFNPAAQADPLKRKQAEAMAAMARWGDPNFRPWIEYVPGRSPLGLFFSGPPAWMNNESMQVIFTMSGRTPIGEESAGAGSGR